MQRILVCCASYLKQQKGVIVAWVYDCTDSDKKSGQSGYLCWLAELRSGNSGTVMHLGRRVPDPDAVFQDPEADRFVSESPSTVRGGIMISRRARNLLRVPESFGGER